jgi:hypothetical protein
VEDKFYGSNEYNALSQEQQNNLRLKYQKCGHVIKPSVGGGDAPDGGDKSDKKRKTMKYIQHTISALSAKIDILNIPYDNDTVSDGDNTEAASNRSNKNLAFQKRGGVGG